MSDVYDPNGEATNSEVVIAGHWELLRRNRDFRTISERWLESEEFRFSHTLTSDYFDMRNHTPRCAWDWMLTPEQRVALARFQIHKRRWLFDPGFNFGPIIIKENFPRAQVTSKNWPKFLTIEPLPGAPGPITVTRLWKQLPEKFKKQFRLAYAPDNEFGELNSRLGKISTRLRIIAFHLANAEPYKNTRILANELQGYGAEICDLSEFYKVFQIPRRHTSEKTFNGFLEEIRKGFKAAKLLIPTKKYDRHTSFQGTKEDWHYFLIAESLGLDMRKSTDARKLALIYSQNLRERKLQGKAPPRARSDGFTGTQFPNRVLKNRRSTVKRHVLNIERWILAAFPRKPYEPGPAPRDPVELGNG